VLRGYPAMQFLQIRQGNPSGRNGKGSHRSLGVTTVSACICGMGKVPPKGLFTGLASRLREELSN
jgi:hypothetical protein